MRALCSLTYHEAIPVGVCGRQPRKPDMRASRKRHHCTTIKPGEETTEMKRFKRAVSTFVITVTVGSLMVLGLSSGAHAAQITFGGSSQAITFTGNGANSVSVSMPVLSGNAFFDADPLGTFSFGATTFTAGPESSNLFPAGPNTESFSFTGGDGDSLSGTVHWSVIQDNTPQPKFFGLLTITSKAGDAAFLSNWGSTAGIDFITMPLSSGGTLDQLAAGKGSASAGISSGEVFPTPEPSTTALLAVGLVLVGIAVRVQQRSDGTRGRRPVHCG